MPNFLPGEFHQRSVRADEDDDGDEIPSMFMTSYTPIKSGVFKIYLFGPIISASQFIPAIEMLDAAGENDIVIIHLSSPGGSLNATDTFLAAMRECEARIIVKATGGVHSAGSVILMNADEFTLSENFNCLVHNGACGPGGKFSDWRAAAAHTDAYMERVMRNTYKGFMTNEEIDQLLAGKDFWFDAEEFVRRFNVRNNVLQEQLQEEAVQRVLDQVKAAKKPRKKRSKEVEEIIEQ